MTGAEALFLLRSASSKLDQGDVLESASILRQVERPTSRVLFGIGNLNLRLGKLIDSMQVLSEAIEKDNHLAVAFHQRGLVHYRNGRLKEALADILECRRCFRDATYIDYHQLGLSLILTLSQVLLNTATIQIQLYEQDGPHSKVSPFSIATTMADLNKYIPHDDRVGRECLWRLQNGDRLPFLEIPLEADIFRPAMFTRTPTTDQSTYVTAQGDSTKGKSNSPIGISSSADLPTTQEKQNLFHSGSPVAQVEPAPQHSPTTHWWKRDSRSSKVPADRHQWDKNRGPVQHVTEAVVAPVPPPPYPGQSPPPYSSSIVL